MKRFGYRLAGETFLVRASRLVHPVLAVVRVRLEVATEPLLLDLASAGIAVPQPSRSLVNGAAFPSTSGKRGAGLKPARLACPASSSQQGEL